MRHLHCERDEAFLGAMEKFIKTTVGNNYNISLTQLLFRKKTMKKTSRASMTEQAAAEESQEDMEKRAFFCSELIAKAFKECGLLNTDDACCQFMPADFAKKQGGSKKLKLEKGAKLGDEQMIMFDEEELKKKRIEFERDEAEQARVLE